MTREDAEVLGLLAALVSFGALIVAAWIGLL